MDVIMHGRLAEVKIWNAISSLALLILEQFKAQLLLISIGRKIVRIQQAEFLSDERPTLNVRLYYPYRQYTNLFLFLFVSEHCFRCTLRLFHYPCEE